MIQFTGFINDEDEVHMSLAVGTGGIETIQLTPEQADKLLDLYDDIIAAATKTKEKTNG